MRQNIPPVPSQYRLPDAFRQESISVDSFAYFLKLMQRLATFGVPIASLAGAHRLLRSQAATTEGDRDMPPLVPERPWVHQS